jgi:Ca2+-binding RTX toxin-like protein
VRCTVAGAPSTDGLIRMTLGDGDDRVDATQTVGANVDAGAGNDTVAGGAGADSFGGGEGDDTFDGRTGDDQASGGPGNDTMSGGAGKDGLNGGAGDDVLRGGDEYDLLQGGGGTDQLFGEGGDDQIYDNDPTGAVNADVVDGGAGTRDIVRYDNRKADVTVDLSKPGSPAGEADEGDALAGIEGVYSGTGVDRLTGDDGPNIFEAGNQEDVLDGRGGDDDLQTRGGPITCGAGDDIVSVGKFEPVRKDCERIRALGPVLKRPVLAGKWIVRFTCPKPASFESRFRSGCTLRASIGPNGRFGKSGSVFAKPGKSGTLTIPLTKAGRADLKLSEALDFRVVVRDSGPKGDVVGTTRFAVVI